jgi:urease accessory protein
MRLLLAALTLVATPTLSMAHSGGDAADLMHGLAHPIGGLDHVLAMLGVGVLAFVLGGRAVWLVPVSFVAMMLVGFVLGNAQVALPAVELGIALSIIAIGAAAASGRFIPTGAAVALVGAFAIFHGHAHGAEMPAASGVLSYALGFALATAGLHALGLAGSAALAMTARRQGLRLAQLAGGAIAIGGVGILAGWL